MLQAARCLVWLTRSPSSLPSPPDVASCDLPHRRSRRTAQHGRHARSHRIWQPDDCWHLMRCSKSVTQNYDNRGTGHCVNDNSRLRRGLPSVSAHGNNCVQNGLKGKRTRGLRFLSFSNTGTLSFEMKISVLYSLRRAGVDASNSQVNSEYYVTLKDVSR